MIKIIIKMSYLTQKQLIFVVSYIFLLKKPFVLTCYTVYWQIGLPYIKITLFALSLPPVIKRKVLSNRASTFTKK